MALFSSQYSVGTTPVSVYVGDGATTVHAHTASGSLYLGGSDVTTSNGYLVDNGDKLTFDTHETTMWAVAPTGTTILYLLVATK